MRRFLWFGLSGLLLILSLSGPGLTTMLAQDVNRAAVVVRYENGRTENRCVAFEEEQISGFELLSRSGLELETRFEGMGAIVCQIDETGCMQGDCLCRCKGGADCTYWSYWHLIAGEWQYAQVGSSMFQVSNGDIDGWSWGPGSPDHAIEPPVISLDDVCSTSYAAESKAAVIDEKNNVSLAGYVLLGLAVVILAVSAVFLGRKHQEQIQR